MPDPKTITSHARTREDWDMTDVHLADAEREALWVAHADEPIPAGGFSSVHSVLERAVESIVAARLAEQREALAAAIDGLADRYNLADEWAFHKAATLVCEYQPGEGT